MATTGLVQNLRILVGKLEGTPGTMENLGPGDFDARVRDPVVTLNVELDDENSRYAAGIHGEDHSIQGVRTAQVTFTVRCVTGPTVSTEAKWVKFLKGCGMAKVAYTSTGIGYQPLKSADGTSMTLWIFDIQQGATPAALCYKIRGAMGNCVIGADGVGKPWLAQYTFSGAVQSVEDVANASILVPALTDTLCADKMLSNIAYVGATAEKISSFSLDFGHEVTPLYDQSTAAGVERYTITARRPRLSMNPLAQLVAQRDVWTDMTSGLTGCPPTHAIGIGDTGIAQKFFVLAPKAQLLTSALANREGLVNWDQNWKLMNNGETGAVADDDLAAETTFEILQGTRA